MSKPKPNEPLIQIRLPRNGSRGYIVNFYIGNRHIAWHHENTGKPCELGRVIRSFLRENNLPVDRTIDLRKTDDGLDGFRNLAKLTESIKEFERQLERQLEIFKKGAD